MTVYSSKKFLVITVVYTYMLFSLSSTYIEINNNEWIKQYILSEWIILFLNGYGFGDSPSHNSQQKDIDCTRKE